MIHLTDEDLGELLLERVQKQRLSRVPRSTRHADLDQVEARPEWNRAKIARRRREQARKAGR